MQHYIYDHSGWPARAMRLHDIAPLLERVRQHRDRLIDQMLALGDAARQRVYADAFTREVIATSAIEGIRVPEDDVYSSLTWHVGLKRRGLPGPARGVDHLVQLVLDATATLTIDAPLTDEWLFGGHSALFSTGYSKVWPIRVAMWRDDAHGPMQIVSGPPEQRVVHFEAPPAERVPGDMARFIAWFNATAIEEGQDPLVRAALAHLWFVTIHPFDDGNGRIARALSNRALAQVDRYPQPLYAQFYSMSDQIYAERQNYYDALEAAQRAASAADFATADIDVTLWVVWFVECLDRAFATTEASLTARKRAPRHRA